MGFSRGFPLLRGAFISWLLDAPSQCFACPSFCFCFFSFRLANPDNAFFARRTRPTPETRCPGSSPAAGKPEILAPCSGVSVSLTTKGEVLGFTSGGFLTTGSSLPLAEISAAGSLVATGPLNGARSFLPPAELFLVWIL
jgi:hypothetical protein